MAHYPAGTVKLGSVGSVTSKSSLPAFVLELDMLDRHGVGVGVEIRLGQKLRDPAAIDLVGDRELAGFVVKLDDDFLAEACERDLGAQAGPEVPDAVGPLFERDVVSDSALERDGVVLGAAGRLAGGAGVAPFAVLHDLGRAFEPADLADAGDVAAVPLDAKLEVLVGIEPLGIRAELGHSDLLSFPTGQPSAGSG